MQLCKCSNQFKFDESETSPGGPFVSRELSAKLRDGEVKLLQGSIHEAELSLREALSVNNEVCNIQHLVLIQLFYINFFLI